MGLIAEFFVWLILFPTKTIIPHSSFCPFSWKITLRVQSCTKKYHNPSKNIIYSMEPIYASTLLNIIPTNLYNKLFNIVCNSFFYLPLEKNLVCQPFNFKFCNIKNPVWSSRNHDVEVFTCIRFLSSSQFFYNKNSFIIVICSQINLFFNMMKLLLYID